MIASDFFMMDWTPTAQENKAHELAERYRDETEAYDRTVCTGPIVDGEIMPNGYYELGLINRNARKVLADLMSEAEQFGVTRQEMQRAISRV